MDGGRSRRRFGAAVMTFGVLSTVGLIALAACTDDDPRPGPTVTAPSSTSPEAPSSPPDSATPTATPPATPKSEPTPQSAEAFVRYFWDVHNYSYATLNVEELDAVADSECTFCSSTTDDIEAMSRAGTRTEGSFIRLSAAVAPPIEIKTGVIVAAVISQDPGRVIRRDGTVRNVSAMAKRQAHISLNWDGKGWLVDDVAIDKSATSP